MTAINPANDFSNSGFIPEIYAKKLAREVKNIHNLSKETVTENGKARLKHLVIKLEFLYLMQKCNCSYYSKYN